MVTAYGYSSAYGENYSSAYGNSSAYGENYSSAYGDSSFAGDSNESPYNITSSYGGVTSSYGNSARGESVGGVHFQSYVDSEVPYGNSYDSERWHSFSSAQFGYDEDDSYGSYGPVTGSGYDSQQWSDDSYGGYSSQASQPYSRSDRDNYSDEPPAEEEGVLERCDFLGIGTLPCLCLMTCCCCVLVLVVLVVSGLFMHSKTVVKHFPHHLANAVLKIKGRNWCTTVFFLFNTK